MLASRYECKYFIRPALYEAIRDYVTPFVEIDKHGRCHPEQRYPICSLYLDNSDLTLHNATMQGQRNRFKLRIRHYSDAHEAPVFFEIKRRVDGTIRKTRARVTREQVPGLLAHELRPADLFAGAERVAVEDFLTLCRRIDAYPLVKIKYYREAYNAIGSEPARITFDWRLTHAMASHYDFSMDGGGWQTTPTDGLIMEIKFTERMPMWLQILVRTFGLQRRSVPKYVLSVLRAGSLGENLAQLAGHQGRRLGR